MKVSKEKNPKWMKIGKRSKSRGRRVETDIVYWLKEVGIETARRTSQFSGKEGTSDVTIPELSNWHIEVKGHSSHVLPQSMLKSWVLQLRRDCPKDSKSVIIWQPNRQPPICLANTAVTSIIFNSMGILGMAYYWLEDSINAWDVMVKAAIGRAHNEKQRMVTADSTERIDCVYFGPIKNLDDGMFLFNAEVWRALIKHEWLLANPQIVTEVNQSGLILPGVTTL